MTDEKKQLIQKIITICLIVFGSIFIIFTIVVIILNQTNHSYVIDSYNKTVSSMSDADINKREEKAKNYNKSLCDLKQKGEYDNDELVGEYDALQLGDVISYIDIPSIDVYLPIYDGTSDDVLQVGIAHEKSTSLPVGGKNTNCVLLGHSGLSTDSLFTDLPDLKKEDVIYLHTLNKKLGYKIKNIYTVLPNELNDYINIYNNKDMVTLITCVPVGVNTHRLVIQAERFSLDVVKDVSDINIENSKSYSNMMFIWIVVGICFDVLILIILFILFIRSYNRRGVCYFEK